jgi:protocatechuate 3,4-dioxygenase beta subunit
LLRGEMQIAITATDQMGSFTFESILPGKYTVILCTDQIEVSITPVELNA